MHFVRCRRSGSLVEAGLNITSDDGSYRVRYSTRGRCLLIPILAQAMAKRLKRFTSFRSARHGVRRVAYQSLRSTQRTINLNCRRSKEFDADAPLHGRSVSPQVFTSTSSVYPQGLLLTDCLLTKRAHEDAVPGTGHRPPTCVHL
jgi:hypothetical protein